MPGVYFDFSLKFLVYRKIGKFVDVLCRQPRDIPALAEAYRAKVVGVPEQARGPSPIVTKGGCQVSGGVSNRLFASKKCDMEK